MKNNEVIIRKARKEDLSEIQKLTDKCIKLIEKYGFSKFKESKTNISNISQLNNLLNKYDSHTYIRENTSENSKISIELDTLPEIDCIKGATRIKVFNINAPNYEKFKYQSYNSGTKIGNRAVKIMNLIKGAINKSSNLIIDFRRCGGGDERVFYDSFGELIGTGILYKTELRSGKLIYCVRTKNKKVKYTQKEFFKKRNFPIKRKSVKVIVGPNTASSAEFIAMILKDSINAKIIGGKTAGYMTLTEEKKIVQNGRVFVLSITIAKTIYDSSGRKYNGFIQGGNRKLK